MAVVPTRNRPALIGYYLAIVSVVPHVAVLSIPAVLLGVMGLLAAKKAGQGRGHVHGGFRNLRSAPPFK